MLVGYGVENRQQTCKEIELKKKNISKPDVILTGPRSSFFLRSLLILCCPHILIRCFLTFIVFKVTLLFLQLLLISLVPIFQLLLIYFPLHFSFFHLNSRKLLNFKLNSRNWILFLLSLGDNFLLC